MATAISNSNHSQLLLSIFPGIDMLGLGFELEGFTILRGPDLIWGGQIERFHLPAGSQFGGVIAGSPCQDFSMGNPYRGNGEGVRLMREFARVVIESGCDWFLLENVATVPDLSRVAPIPGYSVQRFDLNANECGLDQDRLRHFQFGSRAGLSLIPERQAAKRGAQATCIATEGRRGRSARSWEAFCQAQGVPVGFDLPSFSRAAKFAAVGNGVPVPMARVLARAVIEALAGRANPQPCLFDEAAAIAESRGDLRTVTAPGLCPCNCGRPLKGRQKRATVACRKRLQRRRAGYVRPSERRSTLE